MDSVAEMMSVDIMDDETNKELFTISMKGNWNGVIEKYRKNPKVHKAKITSSGDTALHMAVSDDKEDVVEELVGIIIEATKNEANETDKKHSSAKEVLEIKNEQGYTALHLAASIGSLKMCDCIAKVDPSLVGSRNDDNETPLFLAALYGEKKVFLCLHNICKDNRYKSYDYCRRKNGDTILHCAIAGEYFDLAFQIIHLYPDLVNSVNELGLSPLHLLATKPSAFRSGYQLGPCYKIIIYYCFSSLPPKKEKKEENQVDAENQNPHQGSQDTNGGQAHQLLQAINNTGRKIVNLASKALLFILGPIALGTVRITVLTNIRERKEKHTWTVQIMNELLNGQSTSEHKYENSGRNPWRATSPTDDETNALNAIYEKQLENDQKQNIQFSETNQAGENKKGDGKGKDKDKDKSPEDAMRETPILIAAKNGVTEMVEKILERFPMAIHDMNKEKKNIVLLAVENRQAHVYKLLIERNILKNSVLRRVDNKGNNALHLAARLGDYKPWLVSGAALQMQWEIKWYQFVKDKLPQHFLLQRNVEGTTPEEIFTKTHENLVKEGGEWLNKTSESCSVVAALIATVAFAASTSFPGGIRHSGVPNLEKQSMFNLFAISSLVALCFSITALIMFLAILTSRYEAKDFRTSLPRKLLFGLTSLFVSITAILVSFCAGHFYVLKDVLKHAAVPVYALTCLPITFYAIMQFPLYVDLVTTTFKKVPQPSYKTDPL